MSLADILDKIPVRSFSPKKILTFDGADSVGVVLKAR
jgi:hypothetical protein